MVPVARSVPKRPRHLLLSADTRSPSFWVGPIWFPRRDPGPTTPSRRPNDNRRLWTRRGSPEGLPLQSVDRASSYFFLQKRFSMSTEPLVTVTVTDVGPDFEPKWQTRVLVAGPVAVLVTVPHGTVIE